MLSDKIRKRRKSKNTRNKATKHSLNCIYFYLTEGCNLACRHCWIAPKYQHGEQVYPSLDFILFRHIISQAKPLGLSGVKLTGGEPLLHPGICEIITHVKEQNLNLTVETNGLLCTEELSHMIASVRNAFVSVSIDGSKASTHEYMRGVEGCFEKAVHGVKNLVKAGLKPQIIMSVLRKNKDEMSDLVKMAESLGAGSVKFNMVQPTARGEALRDADETLSVPELVKLGNQVENELSCRTSLRLFYSHPVAFRPLGKIYGNTGDGCQVCGILGILGVLASGSYALCGIGETVPELVFGNAAEVQLKDLWKNNPVLTELRKGLPEKLTGICAECIQKHICQGYCVAQNYYRSRSLWAPYWYCEAAHQISLFPETRHLSGLAPER